jgi:predicted nucleic-acid-binding Zn-ribbon protein
MKTLEPVELNPSYIWDCPECGRENFQRSVTRYLDPNDPEDGAVIIGLYGELNSGRLVSAQSTPDRVTCKHCQTEFRVADIGPDDEDQLI